MIKFNLAHAFEIYGGQNPDTKTVRAYFKKVGIKLPCNIIAIELEKHNLKSLKLESPNLKMWIDNSDNGMLYITYNGLQTEMEQLCNRLSLLHGRSFSCATASQWFDTLRLAVRSVREQYLSRLPDANPEHFTLTDELEQQSLARSTFQHELKWQENVELWLDIIMIRHKSNLSNLRRKLIEFLSNITKDIDQSDVMSFYYTQAVKGILSTFAFADYKNLTIQVLSNLRPHLVLNNTQSVLAKRTYPKTIHKALIIIRESYTTPVSLAKLSVSCFISPEHLSRLFKKETGYTVTEFINTLRVSQASQLLVNTDKTVLDIAFESGFNTVEHFHRIFKKHTQMTPHRYRKTHQV